MVKTALKNVKLPGGLVDNVNWEASTLDKFNQILEKVPIFMRGIAKDKVSQKAESLIRKDGRTQVVEKDLVDAFFSETPFGFHGPMKSDMESIGLDYKKYGHQ
jgi:hypothetical protein